MPFPSHLEASAELQAVIETLAATQIGDVATYTALSEAIGADIREQRYILAKALNELARESGAIFSCVHKVGYRRHAAEDAPMLGARSRRRVRGLANRSTRQLQQVIHHANDIDGGKKREILQEIAALQLIRFMATDRIRQLLPEADKPVPSAIVAKQIVAHLNGASGDD